MRKSHKHQMHMVSVATMTAEAIAFIREHEPPEGYFVGFSGGKDSIVTLELVRMSGVKHQAYYSATGIDPPEVVKFIRQNYPEVKWLRPKMSFWEGIQRNRPPRRVTRWCCDVLKKTPSRHIPLSRRIMGIRAEESAVRASRPRISKVGKQFIHKPVFAWLEWHIWDFITEHSLSYPSLYDEGWDRLGCVICPFLCHKNQRAINQHKARWPRQHKAFEHAVTRWWHKMREKEKFDRDKYEDETPEQYIQAWYRGFE